MLTVKTGLSKEKAGVRRLLWKNAAPVGTLSLVSGPFFSKGAGSWP